MQRDRNQARKVKPPSTLLSIAHHHPHRRQSLPPTTTTTTIASMVNHLEFGFDVAARTVTLLGREYSLATLLRTVIFLGAYLLLRPYLLQLSARYQTKDHARDGDVDATPTTDDDKIGSEIESDGEETGWGAAARRRARAQKRRVEEELARLRAEEEEEEDGDAQLNALLED